MTFEILAIIVVFNVALTITLWRTAARKPEKLRKKFITALLHSKPIVPKHQPAKTIGARFSSLVTEEDRLFFGDFTDFAAVVNSRLAGEHVGSGVADEHVGSGWRLQELPGTELILQFSVSPTFGRRYAIFHNQVRLGTLEVSPNFSYSAEKPNVCTNIELDYVRLLTFSTIAGFLGDIASHVCDPAQNEYSQANAGIHASLTQVLWKTQQISAFAIDSQDYGFLELQLNGSAARYIQRRQGLRKQRAAE